MTAIFISIIALFLSAIAIYIMWFNNKLIDELLKKYEDKIDRSELDESENVFGDE